MLPNKSTLINPLRLMFLRFKINFKFLLKELEQTMGFNILIKNGKPFLILNINISTLTHLSKAEKLRSKIKSCFKLISRKSTRGKPLYMPLIYLTYCVLTSLTRILLMSVCSKKNLISVSSKPLDVYATL